MADGGPHFDCEAVQEFCDEIGTTLLIVAARAPWLNGLLEGSNKILLNVLKQLFAPGLGEDSYVNVKPTDIPNNWPDHLDKALRKLSNRILPSLGYSPNELFFGLPSVSRHSPDPEPIRPPTEDEIAVHLTFAEQLHLDGYTATVDHATKRKAVFDAKLLSRAPREVVFEKGDLVQVHATEWTLMVASMRKLVPMGSVPHRVASRMRNSYTLETLEGVPLSGVFNSRRLRGFQLQVGTKLAASELARKLEAEWEMALSTTH